MARQTLTGILTGIFENEKNDALTLDKVTKITLPKGTGMQFLKYKGKSVSIQADDREFQGKTYYSSYANLVTCNDSTPAPAYTARGTASVGGVTKDELIIRQNSMGNAKDIVIYNAGLKKQVVDYSDVLALADHMARDILSKDFGSGSMGNAGSGSSGGGWNNSGESCTPLKSASGTDVV